MRGAKKRNVSAALTTVVLTLGLAAPAAALPKRVWDYDGGVGFATDGAIPNGPCLRISGRMTGDFFVGLKRIDDAKGTEFLRGTVRVTHFPEKVVLQFVIRDLPCLDALKPAARSLYLTPEMMEPLRLAFYWKRGLALRPARGARDVNSFIGQVEPYDKDAAAGLPERLKWNYEFVVPSAGVPLTDHLVIILRMQNGRIIARVAARL